MPACGSCACTCQPPRAGDVIALVACGVVLRVALHWHWISAAAGRLPLLIEAGAAALVAVACGSPFGEPERATGRWLPWLRLGAALGLTATAFGGLAAGRRPRICPAATSPCCATSPGSRASACCRPPRLAARWPGSVPGLRGAREVALHDAWIPRGSGRRGRPRTKEPHFAQAWSSLPGCWSSRCAARATRSASNDTAANGSPPDLAQGATRGMRG